MRLARYFSIHVGTTKPRDVADKLHEALDISGTELRRKGPRGTPQFKFEKLPQLVHAPPEEGRYQRTPVHVDKKKEPPCGDLTIRELYDGTMQVFAATSEPAPAPELTKMPPVFDSAKELFSLIGTPNLTRTDLIWPIDQLNDRKQLKPPLYGGHTDVVDALREVVTLLPISEHNGAPITSIKKDLKRVFEPLGYKYRRDRSSQGNHQLTKRSAGRNQICLDISTDAGSLWRRNTGETKRKVRAVLYICGVDWVTSAGLPVAAYEDWIVKRMAREQNTTSMYVDVRDQAEWLKVLENIAALATAAEKVFFPVAEAVYGPGFAWYEG